MEWGEGGWGMISCHWHGSQMKSCFFVVVFFLKRSGADFHTLCHVSVYPVDILWCDRLGGVCPGEKHTDASEGHICAFCHKDLGFLNATRWGRLGYQTKTQRLIIDECAAGYECSVTQNLMRIIHENIKFDCYFELGFILGFTNLLP